MTPARQAERKIAMAFSGRSLRINRAPVLTLWAAVVAERLGFEQDEALTLGRAVAGLNAYAKGVSLGLFTPAPKEIREKRRKLAAGETLHVDLLGRAVPAARTPEGLRATSKERPIAPESVARYLAAAYGDALGEVRAAMMRLARSLPPTELARTAFHLYEQFRPKVPAGARGWGAKGELSVARIESLAR